MDAQSPDIAALYLLHRDSMHRSAASVLRGVGRASEASDAVQESIVSIMGSPPKDVRNWEAFLVKVAKRKALDRLKSAEVRHSGPELTPELQERRFEPDIAEDIAASLDRQQRAAVAWDCLAVLSDRDRKVVWEFLALERPRREIAAELGVTPARVSQIVTKALELLRDEMNRREGEQ